MRRTQVFPNRGARDGHSGICRIEHEELQQQLVRAFQVGGRTTSAARTVMELTRSHFAAEKQLVFPPLGSLVPLATGGSVPEAGTSINLAERLKSELSGLVSEHKDIVEALDQLALAALDEGHPEIARLAEQLKQRIRLEEEVLYPAAIVVGEYLKSLRRPKTIPARWPERTPPI